MEQQLILSLAHYPEIIKQATEKYDPSKVANYLFELAQLFNDYYHTTSILRSTSVERSAKIILIKSVAQTLKNGLAILGIQIVDRM